jgi:hypothetical protein
MTFILFHVSLATLKKPLALGAFASVVFVGVLGMYFGRRVMPPVPIYVQGGGVGPAVRPDGMLTLEAKVVSLGTFQELYAVTDISVLGHGDSFHHVWRFEKTVIADHKAEVAPAKDSNLVRVASKLSLADLPHDPVGHYTVDVETDSGQIVGRVAFDVRR